MTATWPAKDGPPGPVGPEGPVGPVDITHAADVANPHVTTKTQVGLDSVDNTSDAAKPVSAAQAAINAVKADLVNGIVPTSQVPAVTTGETVPVASQAAMLALTSAQVQPGDVAIRSDQSGRRWLLADTDPSLLGSWIELQVPDAVSSVNSQQGAVILGKGDLGLANVDDTSDALKPISTVQQAVFDVKADLVNGKVPTAQVPSAGRHRTGRWYSTLYPSDMPGNSAGPNNGSVRYTPFWVPEPASFDALAAHISVLASTGTVHLGAYADDGGYPGAAIVRDLAGMSLASTGPKEVLLPIPDVRGLIWLASLSVGQSGGNASFHNLPNTTGSYRHPVGRGTSGHFANMDSCYAGTAGALPEVAPAGMNSTWQTPVIYIRGS